MSVVLKMNASTSARAAFQDDPISWTPQWQLWPVVRAARLRTVLALAPGDDTLFALSPTPEDPLLREAVARAARRAVVWRMLDAEALGLRHVEIGTGIITHFARSGDEGWIQRRVGLHRRNTHLTVATV